MAERYKDSECINILEESLKEKLEVLDAIIAKNVEQQIILAAEEFDMDAFDENTQKKGELIDRLDLLDNRFEQILEGTKAELEKNGDVYTAQIKRMQDMIREITEKSVFIQTTEENSRKAVEQRFKREREKIQFGKSSMKITRQYYNNMRGLNGVTPYFMDDKK